MAHSDIIVGGFGDVRQATYRLDNGDRVPIAVKKLRPQGTWYERIRVVAVSTVVTLEIGKC